MTNNDWAARVAEVWDAAEELGDNILLERIDALVAERPADDPEAAFEAASVRDSTGRGAEAAIHYQRALDLGLREPNRGRTFIQYASTLRNLGRYEEGLALLDRLEPDNELADAASATRALILVSLGRPVEGAAIAIGALAPHLPRYQRSMKNYALALLDDAPGGND
ncbi:MAG TPA: tetratricopeptide repeat protein [Galbitalea sp.]